MTSFRLYIFIFFSVGISGCALTSYDDSIYSGTKNIAQVKDGIGTVKYVDSVYNGNLANGVPNGAGVVSFHNGDEYTGDMQNGNMHGQGRFIYSNSIQNGFEFYEGAFRDDIKSGFGVMVWKSGAKYEGHWRNMQNGEGSYVYPKGSALEAYEGGFQEGAFNGVGYLRSKPTIKNGQWVVQEYRGEFLNNEKNGSGRQCTVLSENKSTSRIFKNERCNGELVTGFWREGKKHGKFSVDFSNGTFQRYYTFDQLSSKDGFFRDEILAQISQKNGARNKLSELFEKASEGKTLSEIRSELLRIPQRFVGIQDILRSDWRKAYLDPDLLNELVSMDVKIERFDKEQQLIEQERKNLIARLERKRKQAKDDRARLERQYEKRLAEAEKKAASSQSNESGFGTFMRYGMAAAVAGSAAYYGKKGGLSQSQIDSNIKSGVNKFLTPKERQIMAGGYKNKYAEVDAIWEKNNRMISEHLAKLDEKKWALERRRQLALNESINQGSPRVYPYKKTPEKKKFISKADMEAPYVDYRITVPGSVNVISNKNSSDVRNVNVVGERQSALADPLRRSTASGRQNINPTTNVTDSRNSSRSRYDGWSNDKGSSPVPKADDLVGTEKKEYFMYSESMAFCWAGQQNRAKWRCRSDGVAGFNMGTKDTIEAALNGVGCPNGTNERELRFNGDEGIMLFCQKPFRGTGKSLVKKYPSLASFKAERKTYKCISENGACDESSSKRGTGPTHTKKKWTMFE